MPVLFRDHNRLRVRSAEPSPTKAGQIAIRDPNLAGKEEVLKERATVAIGPAEPRLLSHRSWPDLHEGLDRPSQASRRSSPLHSPQLICQSRHHQVGHLYGVMEWN